ncbi:RNase P Rpr2/Rpp21 subunit domain protein [Thalictrum thalictroides]|uniref:RNase P Rpr2/Rpp21 subunit domain protein n=1 Tax=Thalictrum thalictroides TaxID=46969 RepID=A0A7J6X2A2_THATH|nr:RNase P Rpr2/Rpp21 subunit domain protein [Thalictrum thalictroides]
MKLNEVKKNGADAKYVLLMEHLQKLALWAGGEASMPSYAAFLGNRLATCGEATGAPFDSSLFPCQKCEAILQPGFNCTVRIETNGAKVRRRRSKLYHPTKNIVIYTCHFCLFRNMKKGTPKHHMKEIFASKVKSDTKVGSSSTKQKLVSSKSATIGSKEISEKVVEVLHSEQIASSKLNPSSSVMLPEPAKEAPVGNSPITPKSLLEGKKKKRKKSGSVAKEHIENENRNLTPNAEKVVGESSRKRRKGWSSLKEIAESGGSNNLNITNLPLPFFL